MSSIGDFKRINKIGQGAFGIAWLVESKIDFHKYVIKEIGLYKMNEKERFEAKREVSLLSKMNHPNIVAYFNSFEEVGCFHILMEYCEGGDLYRRIKDQKGILFKEDQVLDYFIQICLALKHIHDQKILHRDMKPQNIFLTKTNIVKLGDFGIAKVMNSTTALTKTTVGTPFYFSPEICEGRPYNNKSDIWSLGCILYELCSLNYAFYGQDMTILAMQIKRVNYNPIPVVFSAPLRALIDNMFRRRPDERPNINSILRKPFILKKLEKYSPPEFQNQLATIAKKPAQKRPSTANVVSRVDSGLSNKKKNRIGKDFFLHNNPYAPSPVQNVPERKAPNRFLRHEDAKPNPLLVRQQELINKMKVDMFNNARENGWKNIMNSDDSRSDGKEAKLNVKSPAAIKQKINAPAYEIYYAELDRIKEQQKLREKEGKALMQQMLKANDFKPTPKLQNGADGIYRKIDASKQVEDRNRNSDLSNLHGKLGANAGDQAFVVQEFLERKRQAKNAKHRDGSGMAMVMGGAVRLGDPLPIPRQTPCNLEEDISEKLNKIRQKNADNKKGQMFEEFMKRHEMENNAVGEKFNPLEARKAMEELQKKLKQRTEDLRLKLEKKEREKNRESKPTKDEDEPNNVVLFPKRNIPIVSDTPIQNNHPSPPSSQPSITVILEKLNQDISPVVQTPRPNLKESVDNQPSLSVILSQLDDKSSRPSTACNSEQSEIRKLKDDILKRLNKNPKLEPNETGVNEKETPVRKSWVFDMDENHICKDTSLDQTTISDCATMVDVSFLSHDEDANENQTENLRAKWNIEEDLPSDTMILKNIKSENDLENEPESKVEIELDISELDGSTITLEQPSGNIDLPTISDDVDTLRISMDNTNNLSTISEATEDITEIELHSEHQEQSTLIQREEVWIENRSKENPTIEINLVFETRKKENLNSSLDDKTIVCIEDDNDNPNTSDSSESDGDDLIKQLENVLSLTSLHSNSSNNAETGDLKTSFSLEDQLKISITSSLHDLSEKHETTIRRVKSESEININWEKEWSSDSADECSSEDFGDEEIVDPENIFLKIEKIRIELEEKIGIDPLIDAIEFVRENQDLNGDQLAEKLKQLIGDEASINDILHLVVLEEQYHNIE